MGLGLGVDFGCRGLGGGDGFWGEARVWGGDVCQVFAVSFGGGCWRGGEQQQQIPFEDDRKKGNDECKRRLLLAMTQRGRLEFACIGGVANV